MLTLNPFLTALTAGLVVATVGLLGYSIRTAVLCGLLFGLGTIAWPYATTFLRDTLAMAMVSVVLFGWALCRHGGRSLRLMGAGLIALGVVGGVLAKNTVVALGVGVGLALLLQELASLRRRRPTGKAILAMPVIVLLAGAFLAVQSGSGYLARYSLDYYRFLISHFMGGLNAGLVPAVLGPFVSPAKSVFFFSPPMLLGVAGALVGGPRSWRLRVPTIFGVLSLALAQALFYRDLWAGTVGWGLRYMLPAVPLFVMMSAPVVERLVEGGGWRRAAVYGLLGLGAVVQISATLVNWSYGYQALILRGLDPFLPTAAWDLRFLAIPAQVGGLLNPSAWDNVWLRISRQYPLLALAVPLAAACLAILLSAWLWRDTKSDNPSGRAWRTAGVAAALLLPLLPTAWVLRDDPAFGGDQPEFQAALQVIEDEVHSADLVVLDSYGTPLWSFLMNQWALPNRWYSLPFEIPNPEENCRGRVCPPSQVTVDLLASLVPSRGRLWYMASSESPDFGLHREEAWLETHAALEGAWDFPGPPTVVLRLYSSP
jgi:hypothetical protein